MRYMKKIAVLLIAFAAVVAQSCTEEDTTSGGADRLFRPVNVQVSAAGNTFSAKWAAIAGAESYVAELYVRRAVTDSEGGKFDDKELLLRDENVTESTWSVEGLDYATQYYFRVRANNTNVLANSHFTEFYGIKTPAETMVLNYKIDNPVEGIVTFTWMAGYNLTYISLTSADGTEVRHDINDAAGSYTVSRLAAGNYTAYVGNDMERYNRLSILIPVLYEVSAADISYEGVTLRWSADSNIASIELLDATTLENKSFAANPDGVQFLAAADLGYYTTYAATLIYGDDSRSNTVRFTTKDRKPEGMISVSTTEELKVAIATAVDGSVIALNPGRYEGLQGEEDKGVLITKSLTLIPATGVTPVVQVAKAFDINNATISELRFEGIAFEALAGNSYFINVSSGNKFTMANLTFEGCSFTGFGRSLFRTQSNGQVVGAITIDKCIVAGLHETGQNYAVLHLQNMVATEIPRTITISNSTFNGIHSLIQYSKMSDASLTATDDPSTATVTNCTFFSLCTTGQSGRYFVDMSEKMLSTLVMDNCLLAKVNADTYKGVRSKSVSTSKVYFTSDMSFSANALPDVMTLAKKSSEVFVDPLVGDFTLVSGTEVEANKVGDPRWCAAQ